MAGAADPVEPERQGEHRQPQDPDEIDREVAPADVADDGEDGPSRGLPDRSAGISRHSAGWRQKRSDGRIERRTAMHSSRCFRDPLPVTITVTMIASPGDRADPSVDPAPVALVDLRPAAGLRNCQSAHPD
jgi:hypothetical protein